MFLKRSAVVALLFLAGVHSAKADDPYSLTFFNISDPHIRVPTRTNGWRLSKDAVPILLDTLKAVTAEKPDLILLSGDIIEGKGYGMQNLALAVNALAPVSIPWFLVPGNHDGVNYEGVPTLDRFDKPEFFKAFKGHGPDGTKGYWRYDVPQKKVTIIGLDTTSNGKSTGFIHEPQRLWLEKTLDAIDPDRYVVLIMHHPLVVFNPEILRKPGLRIFVLDNGKEIQRLLERYKNVKLVISGHTHATDYAFHHGIHYLSTASINSWPNRYTKIVMTHDTIRYWQVPIADEEKIHEAYRNIVAPSSEWRRVFRTETAVKRYFAHGPVDDTLQIK